MPETILVTGANGFVGSAIMLSALNSGYHVRAAVRRQEAATQITTSPFFKSYADSGSLTTTLVPDITGDEKAFHEAARNCTFIIHTASQIPRPPFEMTGNWTDTAVNGTLAALRAAKANPSVKRVVITSSVYALQNGTDYLPWSDLSNARKNGDLNSGKVLKADTVIETPTDKIEEGIAGERYAASKIASRNAVLEYMEQPDPNRGFSVVLLMPGICYGRNPVARTRKEHNDGTNFYLEWLFQEVEYAPLEVYQECVHIDDVAEGHVNALKLNPSEAVQQFLMCVDEPHGPVIASARDIVLKEMPEVADRITKDAAPLPSIPGRVDTGNTEKVLLGRPFKPWTTIVKDYVAHCLTLPP